LGDFNGGDGEFSDEEGEESIIGGEARGLEEGRSGGGGIGDGDAREVETRPEGEVRFFDLDGEVEGMGEVFLDLEASVVGLGVAVDGELGDQGQDEETPEGEENSLGMFFHGGNLDNDP